jgi:hypothetical protein
MIKNNINCMANNFNPDWDAMAVMVEEQQRMAKRIEGLEAQLAQPEPAECDGGQCGIGGYCKQCPKTQPEPDYEAEFIKDWNEGKVRRVSDGKRMVPEREWQGLTDEEYEAMAEQYVTNCYFDTLEYAKAIEAKLKGKNA